MGAVGCCASGPISDLVLQWHLKVFRKVTTNAMYDIGVKQWLETIWPVSTLDDVIDPVVTISAGEDGIPKNDL